MRRESGKRVEKKKEESKGDSKAGVCWCKQVGVERGAVCCGVCVCVCVVAVAGRSARRVCGYTCELRTALFFAGFCDVGGLLRALSSPGRPILFFAARAYIIPAISRG